MLLLPEKKIQPPSPEPFNICRGPMKKKINAQSFCQKLTHVDAVAKVLGILNEWKDISITTP